MRRACLRLERRRRENGSDNDYHNVGDSVEKKGEGTSLTVR